MSEAHSSDKVCRDCECSLHVGVNWSKSKQKHSLYLCAPCVNTRQKKWRLNGLPRQQYGDNGNRRKPTFKPERIMSSEAKRRARRKNVPYSITYKDIIIPSTCPVLGIALMQGKGKWTDNSPSLDRIIPELGYVPGNVSVISWRANTLKRDATLEELRLVSQWFEGKLNERRLAA